MGAPKSRRQSEQGGPCAAYWWYIAAAEHVSTPISGSTARDAEGQRWLCKQYVLKECFLSLGGTDESASPPAERHGWGYGGGIRRALCPPPYSTDKSGNYTSDYVVPWERYS
eukprot:346539-Amphidinium_carterae.2